MPPTEIIKLQRDKKIIFSYPAGIQLFKSK
jgi:hypothetical protein